MNDKVYFEYGTKGIDYLKSKDAALSKVIDEIGYVQREIIPDMFMALINSIIGQQISTKVQETAWLRFQTMFEHVAAEHIASGWNDMAIIRGLRMLYCHREITPKLFKKYKKRYSPYATVASLYLWEISWACYGLVDNAPKTEQRKRKGDKI